MLGHERDEISRRVVCQGGFTEAWVLANEVLLGVTRIETAVGEIATTAPRNSNFFCDFFGVIEQEDAQAELAGDTSGHKPGGASAHNDRVVMVRVRWMHAASVFAAANGQCPVKRRPVPAPCR